MAVFATPVTPTSTDPHAPLAEIHLDGATARLSATEAELLGLALCAIVDDFRMRDAAAPLAEVVVGEGRTLTRDELIKALLPLPRDAQVNVSLGGESIGITGLCRCGDGEEIWYSLRCNTRCLGDVLEEWRVARSVRQEILGRSEVVVGEEWTPTL